MINIQFTAAGLRRVVLDAPTAPGREFDLAALIAIRPHLLALDRALLNIARDALQSKTNKCSP